MIGEPKVYLEIVKHSRTYAVVMSEAKWDEIRQQPETLAAILDQLNYAADHYQPTEEGLLRIPKVDQ